MVQFYLLSVIYLVLAAGLLLVDKYGAKLLFLINIKNYINSNVFVKYVLIAIGILIALALVFFPIAPGPVILGDILPAVTIIIVLIYLIKHLGKMDVEYNNKKRNTLGFITLGIAIVHFLAPAIVIL